MGNWIRMKYESPKSHNVYEIDVHWEEEKWMPISCSCKSFVHRANCRHLEEAKKESEGLPKPKYFPEDVKPKMNFWIRCRICNGVEFMIKPRPLEDAKLQIICSDCGRMYEL
jgi:hypothetical protein